MIQLLKCEIIKEKLNEEITNDIKGDKIVDMQKNKFNSRKVISLINNRNQNNKFNSESRPDEIISESGLQKKN